LVKMDKNFLSRKSHNSNQRLNLQEITLQDKIKLGLIRYTSKKDIRKLANRVATKSLMGKMGEIKNSKGNLIIQTISVNLIIQTTSVKTNLTKTINRDPSMVQESNPTVARTTTKRKMIGTRIRITSQLTKSRHMFKMKEILR
jgi:hypothetical protein